MSYDFPANPQPGDEFAPPVGGQTYVWQPPRWLVKGIPPAGGGGGASLPEAPVDTKQYGRQDASWTQIPAAPTWTTLTGKPATFPPTLPIAETDVTNLVSDLALKAPLASPTFTGDPKAPTPLAGDNDTSIATTAFVTAAVTAGVVPATATPLMDGVAAVGIATKYAREDHKHPSDTTKADITYVDNANSSQDAITANKVSKAGDSMTGPLVMPAGGTATTTNINFGTAGTGIYGSSTTQINFATSGTLRGTFFTNSLTLTVPVVAPAGSATATSFNFGTAGTGLFGISTNSVRVATTGVERLSIGDTLASFSTNLQTAGGSLYIQAVAGAGNNAQIWFRDEAAVNQGVLYWLRSTDTINLRRYAADGTTPAGDLSLVDGTANGLTLNSQKIWNNGNFPLDITTAPPNTTNLSGLVWNGTKYVPGAAAAPPGGATTQVQFNDAGAFAGNAKMTFDKSVGELAISGDIKISQVGAYPGLFIDYNGSFGGYVGITNSLANRYQHYFDDTGYYFKKYNDAGTGVNAFTLTRADGLITVLGDPTTALGVATKQYVDAKPSGASVSDTAPASPAQGQFWFESSTGSLFVWYTDADSGQWVQVNGTSG